MSEDMPAINEEGLGPFVATGLDAIVGGAQVEELLPGKSAIRGEVALDPVHEATLVIAGLRTGVESVIAACVRIGNAVRAYRGDREREDAFLAGLVEGRVLPRAEAMLGFSSPKLSKLRAIGDHADVLLRPDVLPLLATGYTVCYGATLLYGAIPGDEDAKATELSRILTACPGPLSREYLAEAKKGVERRAKSQKARPAVGTDPPPTPAEVSPDDIADDVANDIGEDAGPKDVGKLADLLLVTPGPDDWRLLRETYPDQHTLVRSLPLHESVAPRAAIVIFGQVRDLPVIENVLLPLCGFNGRSRVLLARRPSSPDITKADIVVMAARGGMRLAADEDLWDAGDIDPASIATRLAPEAVDRLHAFAPSKTTGWRCRVGSETWVGGRPSL